MSEETCSNNCASCGEDCPSRKSPQDFREQPHPQSHIKKVIGVVSGKGGVGKSLVCGMLAVAMRRRGFNTAILDADVTGPSIPKMFGVQEKALGTEAGILPVKSRTGIALMSINLLLEDETQPVVWRGPIIAGTVKQFWTDVIWDDVDYMFVDMPPGTGDVPLTVFQSLPLDGIVIVASPQDLVSMIVAKAVNMAEMMNIPILGVVENMSYVACPDCGKKIRLFGESHIQETVQQHHLALLGELPVDPAIAAACDAGNIEDVHSDDLDAAAQRISQL
nr:Mrp/NBP35 family ATP-binding protein [Maliibacterium massiliense]